LRREIAAREEGAATRREMQPPHHARYICTRARARAWKKRDHRQKTPVNNSEQYAETATK
jgi:hypothetical protein